jgi:hypothetical protein
VVDWYWISQVTPLDWLSAVLSVSNFATIAVLRQPRPDLWHYLVLYAPAVIATVLTIDFSIRQARRRPEERSAWVLLHLLIWTPVAVATLISLTVKPILLDRSLIAISAPLYLLMAWLFVRYWSRRAVQIVAAIYLASVLTSLVVVYPDARRPNRLIELAHYIAAQQQPGDAVAFVDWEGFETTAMLYPNLDDVYILPAPSESKAQWVSEEDWSGRLAYIGWHTPQNIQPVREFAAGYRRVWIVFTRYTQNRDYQVQTNQRWLAENGRLVQELDFQRAAVYIYELAP